jgi:hypothetical protein
MTIDWTSLITGVLAGGVLIKLAAFIATWMNDKGVQIVEAKLNDFGTKLNQNQLMGQIQADDAVVKILKDTLPIVVSKLTADVQADLVAGKMDGAAFKALISDVWAAAKPQITGGAMDYLQHSSFSDGLIVTENVVQHFVGTQKLNTAGVVADPARATTGA